MDIDFPARKTRRRVGCCKVGDGVDRISKLPNEIIVQILSYLTTKQAVGTCILSKRWEYLWTLTPDLDFSFISTKLSPELNKWIARGSFKEYVDRVIFYHGWSILRNCEMHFDSKYVSPYIYSWICALLTCDIQRLTLADLSFTYQQLPWRLFTCKTLMVLRIDGFFVLDVPTYVCLPCLKVLFLAAVIYSDDATVHRLFSGCPVLEDLTIIMANGGLQIMNISVPSLKRLIINNEFRNIMTAINTPRLEYLQLGGDTLGLGSYSMSFLSSLVEARLDGGLSFSILYAISQVKHLKLAGQFMKDLRFVIDGNALPTFHNLKEMKIGLGGAEDWKFLPNLLKCSPKLEVLIFAEGLVMPKYHKSIGSKFGFSLRAPESVPNCLIMHLKKVEIFNFVGVPKELQLVQYFLKHAQVLDKMIIHSFDFSEKRQELQEKVKDFKFRGMSRILNFKRGSSTSVVFIGF